MVDPSSVYYKKISKEWSSGLFFAAIAILTDHSIHNSIECMRGFNPIERGEIVTPEHGGIQCKSRFEGSQFEI